VDQKRAAHGFSVFKGRGGKNVMAFFSLMILRFQKWSELKSASRIIPPQAEGIADTRG